MFYASQSGIENKKEQWLIDSACSKNMFNNIDTMRQTRVKIENEEFMSTSGLGTIRFETKKGK
jgi:hypothetical protein